MSERSAIRSVEKFDRAEPTDLLFKENRVSYQRAVLDPIVMKQQPFDYDILSPTPLDPYHVTTSGVEYFRGAAVLMEGRLAEVADEYSIPGDILESVQEEIDFQHYKRCQSNNKAVRSLRESLRKTRSFNREQANDLVAARAGVSDIGRLALLLAKHPSMGGIEVMKYTKPFDNLDMRMANAVFIRRMREAETERGVGFEIIGNKVGMEEPELLDTSQNVGSHVIAIKGKEADISVGDRRLELMSRYSYIAISNAVEIPGIQPAYHHIGHKVVNIQSIGVTKYLRNARTE